MVVCEYGRAISSRAGPWNAIAGVVFFVGQMQTALLEIRGGFTVLSPLSEPLKLIE